MNLYSIKSNYEDIADSSELINQRREQGQNNTGISNSAIKSKPSMPNVISSQFKNAKGSCNFLLISVGLNNPPSRSQNQRIPKLGNKIEKLNFGDISRYLATEDNAKEVERNLATDSPLSKHYR